MSTTSSTALSTTASIVEDNGTNCSFASNVGTPDIISGREKAVVILDKVIEEREVIMHSLKVAWHPWMLLEITRNELIAHFVAYARSSFLTNLEIQWAWAF